MVKFFKAYGETCIMLLILMVISILLSGCATTLDKLETVGKPPPMTVVADPTQQPDYKPLTWPLPAPTAQEKEYANSLWQPGSRAFFRDQRASRVGDILRVNITIQDKAELDNQTQRSRQSQSGLSAGSVFGLEGAIVAPLPGTADPSSLLDINSDTNLNGTGSVRREEKIETQIAALITQVLPNGNFVIAGSQEVRVNSEIREVGIKGVVRPQDIDSDNTIDSTQIALARINYGGRGQLSDVQQDRWGSQVIDILAPF